MKARVGMVAAGLAWMALASATGRASPTEELELPPLARATLENGLRVVAAEYRNLPLVELTLLVGAGAAQDPEDKSGLANLVAGALKRGTGQYDAQEFAAAVESLGADLDTATGYETTVVTAEFLVTNIGRGLALVADMVLHPAFRKSEIARERAEILAAFRARYEDPNAIATECFPTFLYGGHPYGRSVDGRPEAVERISPKDVRGFYERYYRPNNAVAVIVGDLPAARLLADVRAAFEGWERGAAPPPPVPAPIAVRDRRILVIDKPGATQAQIRFGNVAIARRDPAYTVAQVANTVLGGGFSSRLMHELRIKRSLTYGASSQFVARRAGGDFRVATSTKVSTTGEAVQLALEEVGRFRDRPPTERELVKARSFLRGQFPQRLQSPDALAAYLAEIEWYGLDLEELTRYRARVQAVSRDDVTALVERAVPSPAAVAVVIVGPAAQIVPALEGLGPVEVTTPEQCWNAGRRSGTQARGAARSAGRVRR
jgi:zinc protease